MNEINETEHAVTLFSTSEKVLDRIGKYTKLEIIDTASEKTVRKSRQLTKNLIVKIEKRRLKNNREFKQKNDKTASTIKDRLTPVYDNLDVKIKAVEEKRDNIKNEKIMAEQERLKYINLSLEALSNLASAGMEYNLDSVEVKKILDWIQTDILEEEEFQEFFPRAQEIQATGILNTQNNLDSRKLLEADLAKIKKQKKTQDEAVKALQLQKDILEAEAKNLAGEKAKLDKEKVEAEKFRLVEIERVEAEKRFREDEELFNEQYALGEEWAAEIYNTDWMEAIEFNNVLDYGIERVVEMEEKYQKDLQFDKGQLLCFAENVKALITMTAKTFPGKAITKAMDERTNDLYEWIIFEANELTK